jgi:prepilin-type N-terminal cleavage/methylation domain-containing protein
MSHQRRCGFTLAELIVVILIIALMMALLLPATRRVRESSNIMICQSNMRNLMIAMHLYHADSGRMASPGQSVGMSLPRGCTGIGATPEDRLSWMVSVLPYLESESLHKQINFEKGYPENREAVNTRMKQFLCVSAVEEWHQSTIMWPWPAWVEMQQAGLKARLATVSWAMIEQHRLAN